MTPSSSRSKTVAYFVHDLNDAAVAKRVGMLTAGGVEVRLLGFHRGPLKYPGPQVALTPLGQTIDANLAHRVLAVLRIIGQPKRLASSVLGADAVLARNLEMLLLARVGLSLARSVAPLVYECLDIHRSMLGSGFKTRLLRALEGTLLRRASAVLASSPAFIAQYFAKNHPSARTLLLENKVMDLEGAAHHPAPAEGPPWRIGWFGMIRCRRSLEILGQLASRFPGKIEVSIRGRPSDAEFEDFAADAAKWPGVTFHGPYRPQDLAKIYGEVHFVWAIDYFEEGLNSAWLLPNRLYEGGVHNRPIIAHAEVETGRWLERRDAGVLLNQVPGDLEAFFGSLTTESYERLVAKAVAVPRSDLIADETACQALATAIVGPDA